jgi:56kDa selenium binding protein (SBP56)
MAKLDVTDGAGISFDERFFLHGETFRGCRPHQVRLQGGDASSDSHCYPLTSIERSESRWPPTSGRRAGSRTTTVSGYRTYTERHRDLA